MSIGKFGIIKGRRYWKNKYLKEKSARTKIEKDLMEANGKLKREINDLEVAAEKKKHETPAKVECPADCANKPNYRKCASCIRNPHAVDKYEHK